MAYGGFAFGGVLGDSLILGKLGRAAVDDEAEPTTQVLTGSHLRYTPRDPLSRSPDLTGAGNSRLRREGGGTLDSGHWGGRDGNSVPDSVSPD